MVDCTNIAVPSNSPVSTPTSGITPYDGVALSCISTPATLNEFIENTDNAVCNIINVLFNNISTSQVNNYDGTPTFVCFTFGASPTLNDVIDKLGNEICDLNTIVSGLNCSDIEVTIVPSCYTAATSTLCDHLTGIDNALCNLVSNIPSCLGNNLFVDGDNGTFEAGINDLTDTNLTLTQDATTFFAGTKSLKAVKDNAVIIATIEGDTTINVIAGNTYYLNGYVYVDSATLGVLVTPMKLVWVSAAWGTGTNSIISAVSLTDGLQHDKWRHIEGVFDCTATGTIQLLLTVSGANTGSTFYFDKFTVHCQNSPSTVVNQLVTTDMLSHAIDRLADETYYGGNFTSSPTSFSTEIDDSGYIIDGLYHNIPAVGQTFTASVDTYVDASINDEYVYTAVALGAPEPPLSDDRTRIAKVTTNGVGVSSITDMRNYYPVLNAQIGDDAVETRNILDLNVTGDKLEDIVVGASVSVPNITFDDKGRITAATSDFDITAPADLEILQYNAATSKWVNVTISGGFLPSGLDGDTLRYNSGWVANSLLYNNGTNIGIGTTTPQEQLTITNNFATEMGIATSVTTTAAAGGTLVDDTYYYAVTIVDAAGGETIASGEDSATTSGTNNTVDITWTGVTGAVSYKIYRGLVSGTYTVYFTSTTTSFSDTGGASSVGSPPSVTTAYTNKITATGDSYMCGGVLRRAAGNDGYVLFNDDGGGNYEGLIGYSAGYFNIVSSVGGIKIISLATDVSIQSFSDMINLDAGSNAYIKVSPRLGIGTMAFEVGVENVLGITNGTPPSTSVVGGIQIYSKDGTSGNATIGLEFPEAVVVVGGSTVTHKIPIWVNGTEYWLPLILYT